MKLQGNLINRLNENKNIQGKRFVGEDITKYWYSDRTCYYITRVINDKHIFVRKYKTKCLECYTQKWEHIKDEKEPEIELVYKYNKWKQRFFDNYTGIFRETTFGNISFGVRDYYYDWGF